jgi:hypothetical protein
MDLKQVVKVQLLVLEKLLKSPQNQEGSMCIRLKEVSLTMVAIQLLEAILNLSTSLRTQFLLKICKINRTFIIPSNQTNHMHIKVKWLDLLIRPTKKTLISLEIALKATESSIQSTKDLEVPCIQATITNQPHQ